MTRLALPAFVALLAACAHAPARGPRLARAEGEGWAPVSRQDPAGTRRRALAAALRDAVERAAGVAVTGRTRVDKAVAEEDSVTARSRGVVRSYEIEEDRERDGQREVRIRALVDLDAAPPDPPAGDATIAVRLTGPLAGEAAAAVKRGLLAKGFTVVDGEADVVVTGDVAVWPLGMAGPWLSSRARLSLEARQPRTGRVLYASSREASAVGGVMAAADRNASETAGELGGEELAAAVAARLND